MRNVVIKILAFILIIGCAEESEPTQTRSYYVKVIDANSSEPIAGASIEIVSCYLNTGPIGPPCCRISSNKDNKVSYTNSKGLARVEGLTDWDEECEISHPGYLNRICYILFGDNCWDKTEYTYDTAIIEVYGLYPKAEIKFTYKGNNTLSDSIYITVSGYMMIEYQNTKCQKRMVDYDFLNKNIYSEMIYFRANRDTTFTEYAAAEKVLNLNFWYYVSKDKIWTREPAYVLSKSISPPGKQITVVEIPAFK